MLAADGVGNQRIVQPHQKASEVIDLSKDDDSLDYSSSPCCEGEAALRPDDDLVLLNYSMVRHRVGDIFVHTKSRQLVASSNANELRPMASFLGDIGLALVLHHYPAAATAMTKAQGKESLPDVSHLLTPFRFRCASCPFRSDTELGVVLHYQQGHVTPEGLHKCALDKFSSREPQVFSWHMRSVHGLPGRSPVPPPAYQCDLCVANFCTPRSFYRHACPGLGARPLAPGVAGEDQQLPAACCLQLDSLHLFGVTELNGRLDRGTFYGKRIVMSPQVVLSSAAAEVGPNAVSASRWPPPLRTFSTEPVRLRSTAGPDRPPFVLCELCHGAVRSFRRLARHMRSAHGFKEPAERLEAALRSPAGRRCPGGCQRRFFTRRGLSLHLAWGGAGCPAEARPTCRHCGCRLADSAALCDHYRARHPAELLASLKSLRCPICPPVIAGSYSAAADLARHLAEAHRLPVADLRAGQLLLAAGHRWRRSRQQLQRLFACHACPASFASPQHLAQHAAASGHRLGCRRCRQRGRPGVEFACREVWAAHLRVAHRNDTDKCQICSKQIQVGPDFVGHVMKEHLRPCYVRLIRVGSV